MIFVLQETGSWFCVASAGKAALGKANNVSWAARDVKGQRGQSGCVGFSYGVRA